MSSNDGEEGAVDAVDFDSLEDEDLPGWATQESSVPTGAAVEDSAGADLGDTPGSGAAAALADTDGFDAVAARDDTAGTSIDPDLDDVDPMDVLEAIAGQEEPRTRSPVPGRDPTTVGASSLFPDTRTAVVVLGALLALGAAGGYLGLAAAGLSSAAAAGIVATTVLTLVFGALVVRFDEHV
ncbi:hypothetical protein [Haloglomus litoreum]|uniref:hypothetical protein n=1 Tax=Haloglomus litoreum TaxID=3034026 RepID=UPI0023E86ED1|nr:hypothetical protein [Haloglomus sp. DT116]